MYSLEIETESGMNDNVAILCQLFHVILIKTPYMYYRRFSLHGSHLVDALRHFLESFRLPGESPIIARILECFSEHWLVGIYYYCKE